MAEKIKAINPEIIVSGDVEKPYFQIKYYDTADSTYHIGFGSYNYGNVLGWLKEYFEPPIETDEQPVVRCNDCIFKNHPNEYGVCCCERTKEEIQPSDFCSHAVSWEQHKASLGGAKMDEESGDE